MNIRAVEPPFFTKELGEPPVFAWIETDKIKIDPTYQRDIDGKRSESLINKMAKNFKWDYFGTLSVSLRPDGSYYARDGQHRIAAAMKLELSHVPCIINSSETNREEAESFVHINKERNAISSLSIHHAAIVAGDETHIEIAKICKNAGVTISRKTFAGGDIPWGVTTSIGALKRFYYVGEGTVLTNVLIAINEASIIDGEKTKGYLLSCIIHSVAKIYIINPEIDPDLIIDIIRAKAPDQWQNDARAYSAAVGGTIVNGLKYVMCRDYNKGLHHSKHINHIRQN